jgi:FKBP-type peptidyl-prolyl cis-trans isomerase
MKITQLAIAFLVSISVISCQKYGSVSIKTEADSVSYILGAYQGQSMLQNFKRSEIDSLVNMDLYFEAFYKATEGKELRINPDSNKTVLDQFFQSLQAHQMQKRQDTAGVVGKYNPSKTLVDTISYLLGADFGLGLIDNFSKDGLDTVLNIPLIIKGYASALSEDSLAIDPRANIQMLDVFFKKWQEEQMAIKYSKNKEDGEEYLAKNRENENVFVTESGLQYEIIKEGTGEKPTASDRVKVHYHGTFINGDVFDSSVERGQPATFGVGQVIKGWTEALQLMPVGSKWKLTIPYDLAYGTQDRGAIPPFSTLIFEVELLEIVK